MPEEVLFADERPQDRSEIAATLRTIADKLDAGEPFTLASGDDSITLEPSERPTFEVKVEREASPGSTSGELSVELEIEWDESAEGSSDSSLRVE